MSKFAGKKITVVSGFSDKFRITNNLHWFVENNDLKYGNVLSRLEKQTVQSIIDITTDLKGADKTYRIELISNKDQYKNRKEWLEDITAIFEENKLFKDFTFELDAPFSEKDLENIQLMNNPYKITVQPKYNFHSKNYEGLISRNTIKEKLLPTVYSFSQAKNKDILKTNAFKELLLLGGLITDKLEPQKGDLYFTDVAKLYSQFTQSFEYTILDKVFSNICVSLDKIDRLNDSLQDESDMPMSVSLQLDMSVEQEIISLLKKFKLGKAFIQYLLDTTGVKKEAIIKLQHILFDSDNVGLSKSKKQAAFEEINIRRIESWFEDLANASIKNKDVFLNSVIYSNETGFDEPNKLKILKDIFLKLFQHHFDNIYLKNIRTYKDILDGKFSYNETVFYRIQKEDNSGNVLQSVILPNYGQLQTYIDSQIKYNKPYKYKVFVYQAVFGSEYYYSNIDAQSDSLVHPFKATIDVIVKPYISIIELQVFESETITLLDKPPLPPDVTITNYKGNNHSILFMLNGVGGEREEIPITINSGEKSVIDLFRKNQHTKNKIFYKSDDFIDTFEVYKLNTKPEKYSDFVNKGLKLNNQTAFIDNKLRPNRKYYYMFRGIDSHQHFSNPTPIYEVELVSSESTDKNTGVAVYLVVNTVELEKNVSKALTKDFKKIIQISPMIAQAIIDEANLNDTSNIYKPKLGVTDESIWGKTFRLVFTSKSTGKKIFIDATFNNKYELVS